jgi:cysteine-rich repeat protein
MRLHHLVAAAAVSLFPLGSLGLLSGCTFDATGLSAESSGVPNTSTEPTTGVESTTGDPTTGDPTTGGGELCGNFQQDPGEECDNGPVNGTMGTVCKGDCTLNFCGDGYAASNEGCDDGNQIDDDACSNDCKLAGCGNGEPNPGEECDDGNDVDDDACSDLCKLPKCGDGNVGMGEECDDGTENGDNKACTLGCLMAECGDGLLWMGQETCDDGNDIDDDECSNMCKSADCGDGVLQMGEECDDQNDVDTDECTNICKNATCGDSIVGPGEQCDMGNNNGDMAACTADCQTAMCGDGLVFADMEECDDGNLENTDACINCTAATCGDGFVQAGVEQCDGGDTCDAMCNIKHCGNGMIEMAKGEECDDSNNEDGDTCSKDTCKRLAFMVFVTQAKFKGGFGGLEDADTQCNMAAAGKLPGAGKYKAWLSDETVSAASRLEPATQMYILPNNMKVADSWTDLTDGSLDAPINRNESGNPVGNGMNCTDVESLVWTGTIANGSILVDEHCTSWTVANGGSNGRAGVTSVANSEWTTKCTLKCDASAHLYCIEQP